jgi:hypothetical protein
MYRICVPPGLTIPHLLEWEGVNPTFRDLVEEVVEDIGLADQQRAVAHATQIRLLAGEEFDPYAAALACLLQAEALRHLRQWEDCLATIHEARRWLRLRIGAVASYNCALAAYLEGLIQFTARDEVKALSAFSFAARTLEESRHYWSFECRAARAEDCRRLASWVSDLGRCISGHQAADTVLILPIYGLIDEVLSRTATYALNFSRPILQVLRIRLVKKPFIFAYKRLELNEMVIEWLDPLDDYFAIRFQCDRFMGFPGSKGDLLVLQTVPMSMSFEDEVLAYDDIFVRGKDGHVGFRWSSSGASHWGWISEGYCLRGKPVLIIGGMPNGSP